MKDIKICRDCKWHSFVTPLLFNEYCRYEQETAKSTTDVVTGKVSKPPYKISCTTARSNLGHCKHEGRNYSPSVKKRVIQWMQNGIFSFPSK